MKFFNNLFSCSFSSILCFDYLLDRFCFHCRICTHELYANIQIHAIKRNSEYGAIKRIEEGHFHKFHSSHLTIGYCFHTLEVNNNNCCHKSANTMNIRIVLMARNRPPFHLVLTPIADADEIHLFFYFSEIDKTSSYSYLGQNSIKNVLVDLVAVSAIAVSSTSCYSAVKQNQMVKME